MNFCSSRQAGKRRSIWSVYVSYDSRFATDTELDPERFVNTFLKLTTKVKNFIV